MVKGFTTAVLAGALLAAPAGAAEPGSTLQFTSFAKTNARTNPKWSPVLQDVVNHEAPGDSNPYTDLVTLAHETSHGIHAWIRNHLTGAPTGTVLEIFSPAPDGFALPYVRRSVHRSRRRANAFYVLQDRAVIIDEPNIRKSQVGPFVPAPLRGPRYALYVEGQTSWDDTPLYLWDEWNAYANGGQTGVDLVKNNLWTYGQRDAVYGPLEFVSYALATGMAVKAYDPNYFAANTQFREFLAYNIKRSMETFDVGSKMPPFARTDQDQYVANLRTGAAAEPLRQFTRSLFGTDWTKAVLGF